MPLTIQVEGINVYGTHGVYDQEKINGQNFRIDLLIELKKNIPGKKIKSVEVLVKVANNN